ncbi:MAG: carbohydrate ABC transporter substrate-binding protein [Clostridiales bacterium]|nr:carbohydrate ABC transporter substrate-binding protein [Clostridiales bacterium]
MKKKLLSLLLATMMILGLLAGCSKSGEETSTDPEKAPVENGTEDAKQGNDSKEEAVEVNEGKVFNIYCWNTEFQDRVKAYYPGYTDNGDGTGKIGDIAVNWVITPSDDNAYQNALDAALLAQADAADDEKVDLFLIEADYALKYINTDYAMDVEEIGLTADDMKDQYQYTKDIVTDSNGKIRGTTWQATPGLFAYRRSIANDVLGTDDPAEVQKRISNWDDFNAVAEEMKSKGYTMLSGYDDAYRTFSNNVAGPWVQDGKVIVDDNLMKWVDQTKEFTDKGYNNKTSLWSDGWAKDQGPDGKTFGFFYSTWGINFTLMGYSLADSDAEATVGNGIYGDWAVTEGPAPFYWGGTWICAATGTDNPSLVKDIMYTLTCDADTMKKITQETQDYTNNQKAMEEIANSDFQSEFLGGQNHIALFASAAPKIDMSNISPYDQGCNEEFQSAFKDYFDGNVTKEDALQNFYDNIVIKYPELTY